MEKHSHIVRLREREVTYFPVSSQAAPQQPVLQHDSDYEEEPWADRVWRIWVKPFAWYFFWMCFWFAVGVFSIIAGIYLIKIGGVR